MLGLIWREPAFSAGSMRQVQQKAMASSGSVSGLPSRAIRSQHDLKVAGVM